LPARWRAAISGFTDFNTLGHDHRLSAWNGELDQTFSRHFLAYRCFNFDATFQTVLLSVNKTIGGIRDSTTRSVERWKARDIVRSKWQQETPSSKFVRSLPRINWKNHWPSFLMHTSSRLRYQADTFSPDLIKASKQSHGCENSIVCVCGWWGTVTWYDRSNQALAALPGIMIVKHAEGHHHSKCILLCWTWSKLRVIMGNYRFAVYQVYGEVVLVVVERYADHYSNHASVYMDYMHCDAARLGRWWSRIGSETGWQTISYLSL
jgi:hypothetical protein